MTEASSAFFRFLELPVKLIKRDEFRARQLAASGFAVSKCDMNIIACHKDSTHTVNVNATAEEIDLALENHDYKCSTRYNFPTRHFLNYASHRILTFLTNEVPKNIVNYDTWANNGFYYSPITKTIKCHFCTAEVVDFQKIKGGPQHIHLMRNPSCPLVTEDEKVGNVSVQHERSSKHVGFILQKEKHCKNKNLINRICLFIIYFSTNHHSSAQKVFITLCAL